MKDRIRDPIIHRLPGPPAYLTVEEARRIIDDAFHFKFTEPITDVTLSAALTNAGGAYLELNSPSYLECDNGVIQWLASATGTCYGEIYVHLPGAAAGATYLGQMRCAGEAAFGHEGDAYIAVNVFGSQGGSQFGRILFRQSPMVVPFMVTPVQGSQPWVAFNPSGMRNWHVYDVRVRKV